MHNYPVIAQLQQLGTNIGVYRDVCSMEASFYKAGYFVRINWGAKKADVLAALHDASAIGWAGHTSNPGQIATCDPDDVVDGPYLEASDFSRALHGRKLDWAIIHACYSDTPAFRDALVGKRVGSRDRKGNGIPH